MANIDDVRKMKLSKKQFPNVLRTYGLDACNVGIQMVEDEGEEVREDTVYSALCNLESDLASELALTRGKLNYEDYFGMDPFLAKARRKLVLSKCKKDDDDSKKIEKALKMGMSKFEAMDIFLEC